MSEKISKQEPAPRPFTVALSVAEVITLMRYHVSEARRIPKRMGQAILELQASSALAQPRAIQALHNEAKAQIEAHAQRANVFLTYLKP